MAGDNFMTAKSAAMVTRRLCPSIDIATSRPAAAFIYIFLIRMYIKRPTSGSDRRVCVLFTTAYLKREVLMRAPKAPRKVLLYFRILRTYFKGAWQ